MTPEAELTVTEHDATALDPDTAALRLYTAIQQLTEPGIAELDRDIPVPGTDAYQLAADDRALEDKLWTDVTTAAAAHDRDQLTTALADLDRLRARRAARTAPAAPLPSLLQQLQDAIPNGGDSSGSSPGGGASRSPLAVAALDLVTEIATTVGARTLNGAHATLHDYVIVWAHRVGNDETQVIRAAQAAGTWPDRGRNILDPPKRWTTPGACPTCKRTTAHVRNDDGDTVRRPTIELDTAGGTARCLGCGTRWEGESQLRQLAKVLTEDDGAP